MEAGLPAQLVEGGANAHRFTRDLFGHGSGKAAMQRYLPACCHLIAGSPLPCLAVGWFDARATGGLPGCDCACPRPGFFNRCTWFGATCGPRTAVERIADLLPANARLHVGGHRSLQRLATIASMNVSAGCDAAPARAKATSEDMTGIFIIRRCRLQAPIWELTIRTASVRPRRPGAAQSAPDFTSAKIC